MKKDIHPTYYPDAQVICACGNTWKTGSTRKLIRTELCSKCHPFFTGQQQRLIDVEGQVDRFYRRLQARQVYAEDRKAREEARTSPERLISDLNISSRALAALNKAEITKVGQVLTLLAEGEEKILQVDGFGRHSLIDLKKKLRQAGYKLPENLSEQPAA